MKRLTSRPSWIDTIATDRYQPQLSGILQDEWNGPIAEIIDIVPDLQSIELHLDAYKDQWRGIWRTTHKTARGLVDFYGAFDVSSFVELWRRRPHVPPDVNFQISVAPDLPETILIHPSLQPSRMRLHNSAFERSLFLLDHA